jgi:hypothetical protein
MAHQGTPRWSAHALRRTASRVLLAVTLPLVTAAPAALAWPQAAAAQTRGTITVEAPTQGASVTSPVTIRGRVLWGSGPFSWIDRQGPPSSYNLRLSPRA